MTQTTQPPLQPSQVMLHLSAILLAPMFLTATGGDIALARAAATDLIDAYRSVNQAGQLAAAQIAAFGITALGSLSLSMADTLTLSMTLRLRGNANALNRSAEQNRRALKSLPETQPEARPDIPMTPEDHRREAEAIARVEAARQAVANARIEPAQPKVQPEPAKTLTSTEEQNHRLMWANAISEVAGEFTASLPSLPPMQRKLASRKAALLSSSVTDLLSGKSLPELQRAIMAGEHPVTR